MPETFTIRLRRPLSALAVALRGAARQGLGRLSVGRKLILIFLLDMTAVAFISGILVNEKYLAINFARKEVAGNAYIAQARAALVAVGGNFARPFDTVAMARYAASLEAAERRLGADMGSADASRGFIAELGGLTATSGDHGRLQQALQRGRELVTRVGNLSNLILDPDLDSYYTMSLVVLRYPELLDVVTSITTHVMQRDRLGEYARTRFLILEGRLDASRQGIESDFGEAFTASTPALREALDPSRQQLLETIERYRQAARGAMSAGSSISSGEIAAIEAAHLALMDTLNSAWTVTGAELDRLLEIRIAGFFTRMWTHLGTALGLLALILCAVFFVARQIARPLHKLSIVTDTVSRTGDYSLRASWNSHDEIGRLVVGFNEMLAQLDQQRAAQQELAATARAAEAQQQLVEAIPIPLMVTAIPGHQVLHANGPAQAWLAGHHEDPWRSGLESAVRARFFQQLADREGVDEYEVRWRAGNEQTWAVLSARRLRYQGSDAVLTAFTPINHLKMMERRLELWAKVFEASSEGIVIVDSLHRVVSANRAFCRSTQFAYLEVVGGDFGCVDDGHGAQSFLANLWPVVDTRGSWQGEVTVGRRDGSTFPAWLMVSAARDGKQLEVSHYIATLIDISDRKRNEERIHFLAHHDVLTELPNRSLCVERLRAAVQHAERTGGRVAVLFIDLDRFKNINDSLGHHVGDSLLRSVARRLLDSVRVGDTVSRLGGDEFVVVLNGVVDADEISTIVEQRLVPLIGQPHDINGAELTVSCSVGIAVYPDDAQDIDTLMRHADAAMYQAKSAGRNAAHFFTAELNERAHRRLQLESQLRHAVERDEFQLHYQPKVDAAGGRLVGVEALLRWHSAELGVVPPARFIPIAEEAGLIVPIGAWVIDEACRQHARWRDTGVGEVPVAINVSALQLRDGSLVETLGTALERHAVPPGAVEIELTESTLMENVSEALGQLRAIKRLGVTLAIDDFGTGYSSLNYLNRFPIDRLKIDRSFVRDMLDDPTNLAITRAIIGLGHTLGLKVVAEGVETEREAQTLRTSGCDELQGYLTARPMPAADLAHWLGVRTQPRSVGGSAVG
jgi:diguanylate cyclase (GGDEF)-like protein/PAS domain S-box-containing protein